MLFASFSSCRYVLSYAGLLDFGMQIGYCIRDPNASLLECWLYWSSLIMIPCRLSGHLDIYRMGDEGAMVSFFLKKRVLMKIHKNRNFIDNHEQK
jgi:hypothetical protein